MVHQLLLSSGQAYVTAMPRRHRTSLAVQCPQRLSEPQYGGCAVIADSPSHNAIARQAANLAVRGFLEDYYSTPAHWDTKYAVHRVLRALNLWCYSQSRFIRSGSYVSAFSAVLFKGDTAHLFHVGDTRIYRIRGAECDQLTRDHITALGGYRYPSRALGMDVNLDLEYMRLPIKPGDIFLFTTQAVNGTLSPMDYMQVLSQHATDLDDACQQLCDRASEHACQRGYGDDTFCFQLVRVDQIEAAPSEQQQTVSLLDGEPPVPVALRVGDELDGYRVEEVMQRTEKVCIYRVLDPDSGRRFVLQTISPQLSRRSPFLKHFVHQRKLIERVRSPFINRVANPPRPRHYYYYLLNYINGDFLPDWLRAHPDVSYEHRLDLAQQMCKAVSALTHNNVIHQRLCPESFLIDEHGQIMLIDFMACEDRELATKEELLSLTCDIGLTPFSAPEYALNDDVGRRSDQFSLAALIYWLLSYRWDGEVPHGEMPYAVPLDSIRSEAIRMQMTYISLRKRVPKVSVALDNALRRALSPQRGLRYRRLSEFLIALRPEQRPLRIRRQWSLRRQFGVAIGGVILLALTLWLHR